MSNTSIDRELVRFVEAVETMRAAPPLLGGGEPSRRRVRPVFVVAASFAAVLLIGALPVVAVLSDSFTLDPASGQKSSPAIEPTPNVDPSEMWLDGHEHTRVLAQCLQDAGLEVVYDTVNAVPPGITFDNRVVSDAEFEDAAERCDRQLVELGYSFPGAPTP